MSAVYAKYCVASAQYTWIYVNQFRNAYAFRSSDHYYYYYYYYCYCADGKCSDYRMNRSLWWTLLTRRLQYVLDLCLGSENFTRNIQPRLEKWSEPFNLFDPCLLFFFVMFLYCFARSRVLIDQVYFIFHKTFLLRRHVPAQ
jgi:hypothetical protein